MKKRSAAVLLIVLVICLCVLTSCGGGSKDEDALSDWKECDFEELEGSVQDGIYTNEFLGITFDAHKTNWVIADDSARAGLADVSGNTDFEAIFRESGSFCDFYVQNSSDRSAISVVIADLGLFAGARSDVDDYVEYLKDSMAEELEAQGLTNVKSEVTTTFFLGDRETPCVAVEGEYMGVKVFERQIFIKKGRYVGGVIVMCVGRDMTQERLGGFKAI